MLSFFTVKQGFQVLKSCSKTKGISDWRDSFSWKNKGIKVLTDSFLCKMRPYYVKSRGFLRKNTPFLFHGSVKICEMLEKRPLFLWNSEWWYVPNLSNNDTTGLHIWPTFLKFISLPTFHVNCWLIKLICWWNVFCNMISEHLNYYY